MQGNKKTLLKDAFIWGFILWLFGYVVSFILFFIVPPSMIGWIIAPIGTALTSYVLLKKVTKYQLKQYLLIAIVWTVMAVVLDYFFIVKLLNPVGYYKPAVYFYYGLTFGLPLLIGHKKNT